MLSVLFYYAYSIMHILLCIHITRLIQHAHFIFCSIFKEVSLLTVNSRNILDRYLYIMEISDLEHPKTTNRRYQLEVSFFSQFFWNLVWLYRNAVRITWHFSFFELGPQSWVIRRQSWPKNRKIRRIVEISWKVHFLSDFSEIWFSCSKMLIGSPSNIVIFLS